MSNETKRQCDIYGEYLRVVRRMNRDSRLPLTVTIPAYIISDSLSKYYLKNCVLPEAFLNQTRNLYQNLKRKE